MAIQPIDLQTMYVQLSNVAQSAQRLQQGGKLTEIIQQQNVTEQDKERSERVQETSSDETKAANIRDDGGGSAGSFGHGNSRKKQHEENSEEISVTQNFIRDPRLGQHIDITR